jgi:hypothetical protein
MSSFSPTISTDPRFILARKLITSGSPESAIDIFANLLERCREKLGEESLDAALCQYEYGNALFRAVLHRQYEVQTDAEDERKPAAAKSEGERQREIMAAAAEKRFGAGTSPEPSKKRAKTEAGAKKSSVSKDAADKDIEENADAEATSDEDDVDLALEMIETSLHILLARVSATPESGKIKTMSDEQKEWSLDQIPRFLICLGDVYSFQEEHGKSVDAYIRALSYREDKWKEMKECKDSFSIQKLKCKRLYIEACCLVAEALLACPDGEDVVCDGEDETVTYAKASERVDFANSWYEMAREELDDLRELLMHCLSKLVFF